MKLYGDPISTTCRPVMLLAAESGADLKLEFVDLFTGAHMKPEYAKLNPPQRLVAATNFDATAISHPASSQ